MHKIIIITGVSGCGKTVLSQCVFSPEQKLVTTTSRNPREGEVHGVDYYFTDKTNFERLVSADALIEHNEFANGHYGLTKEEFQQKNEQDDVYIILDHNGARQYKRLFPNSLLLFIDIDKEDSIQNMRNRGDSEAQIAKRLEKFEKESSTKTIADHVIVNRIGHLDDTVAHIRRIIDGEKGPTPNDTPSK